MRKIIALALCMILVCSSLCLNVSAAELPDGGQIRNTGEAYVTGYTSGGDEGYARVTCTITGVLNGPISQEVMVLTATTQISFDSRAVGVQSYEGVEAYTTITGWYGEEDDQTYESSFGSVAQIPATGFSMTLVREEGDLYKGTAGHGVDSTNYGNWICGTTMIFFDGEWWV